MTYCCGTSSVKGISHVLGRQPCKLRATVTRDGKPYCGRHDPVAVKLKFDARMAMAHAGDAKRAAMIRDARDACQKIVDALKLTMALARPDSVVVMMPRATMDAVYKAAKAGAK